MKTFVKKTAAAAILVLLALFLVTCVEGPPEFSSGGDIEYTDWEYEELPDGTAHLTMYLDGTVVPVTASTGRALSLPLAKMSHDYFEAVFVYGTGPTATVARATWELGQAAGISGVYRSGAGGVNYTPVTAPSSATGAASTVFVGRKQTMTLLGVGYLTHINKVVIPYTAGVPDRTLTTSDKSVTFTVSPLKANLEVNEVDKIAGANSSFVTATKDSPNHTTVSVANTTANLTPLGGTRYPLFVLPTYEGTAAEGGHGGVPGLDVTIGTDVYPGAKLVDSTYTIGGLSAGDPPAVFQDSILNSLAPAVILYDGPEVIKREPRFIEGGQYWYAKAQIDFGATGVRIGAAYTEGAGAIINPVLPIQFLLTPSSSGIFSIVFSIPVYAIVSAPSTNGAPGGEIWHITPGYGQNLYNLDSGKDSGGCVLMGIGITDLDFLEIFTTGVGFSN
jgi:hypothetical protein